MSCDIDQPQSVQKQKISVRENKITCDIVFGQCHVTFQLESF